MLRRLHRNVARRLYGRIDKGPAIDVMADISLRLEVPEDCANRRVLELSLTRDAFPARLCSATRMFPDVVHDDLFETRQMRPASVKHCSARKNNTCVKGC